MNVQHSRGGRGSSVGIATERRAGRSGDQIPVGERFSAPVETGHGAHPASYAMGTRTYNNIIIFINCNWVIIIIIIIIISSSSSIIIIIITQLQLINIIILL